MRISLIVAVSENGVIGRDNALPWRLPDDLRRFRELTTGHAVLMGRRTFESIGRPLPRRRNLVLSRSAEPPLDGVEVVSSIEEAVRRARDEGEAELFVAGGSTVYEAALPLADRLYVTRVHAVVEGDVRLPDLDLDGWTLVSEEHHPADADHRYPFTFRVYDRR